MAHRRKIGYQEGYEEKAMDDMTLFNLQAVNKGALKATVSIRLVSGRKRATQQPSDT
jgi:hypothetical protein